MKNIFDSLKEFVWMWVASLIPVIFGSLIVAMRNDNFGYLQILCMSFNSDLVFAYIATMISPFLFITAKLISDNNYRKEFNGIKYGGTCLVSSFLIILVVTSIFSISKDNIASSLSSNGIKTYSIITINSVGSNPYENLFSKISFENKLLIICYFLGLFIWYYSIFLKNLEPRNIESEGKERVDGYMEEITSMTEGSE